MEISVSDAKAQLTNLVRRAEAGEEVVLTRHGRPVARVAPAVKAKLTPEEKLRAIREIQERVKARGLAYPNQTSDHDFLYDEFGLPK